MGLAITFNFWALFHCLISHQGSRVGYAPLHMFSVHRCCFVLLVVFVCFPELCLPLKNKQAHPDDGSVYVATGNGLFNANTGGYYYSDSIVRLRPGLPNQPDVVMDSYTPVDYKNMQDQDYDLGSSNPCLLPPIPASKTPLMLVQARPALVLFLIIHVVPHCAFFSLCILFFIVCILFFIHQL